MKTEPLNNLLKMTGILVLSFLPIALIANYKLFVDSSSFNIHLYRYFAASWLLVWLLCFVGIVIMFKVKKPSRKKLKSKKSELIKYHMGVWIIFWIVMVLIFLFNPILGIVKIIIFFVLKANFEQWVKDLNTNPNYPFLLVLFFGLLGHIVYYIYSRTISK